MDAILALRHQRCTASSVNQPLHVAVVDLKATFDSVDTSLSTPAWLKVNYDELHDLLWSDLTVDCSVVNH